MDKFLAVVFVFFAGLAILLSFAIPIGLLILIFVLIRHFGGF